jgi:phosphoribosyl 1,2-cyclic phosphodiesterase
MVTANNGKRLMIECGVSWAKLQEAINFDLNGIEACLISHEHADHCKAVRDVRKAGIEVYASEGTFKSLGIGGGRRINCVSYKTLIRCNAFEIYCFNVNHDAAEPLGFVIREKATNEFLLFATDTSYITQQFKYPFSIIAIECSYDLDWLTQRVEDKDINEVLAKRLLTSHMEKQNAMNYLQEFCDLSKCRQIHLLHCSGDNMDKEKVRIEFEKKFFIETKVV